MSRTGKKQISIPEKVKASIQEGQVQVEGPQGKLFLSLPKGVSVLVEGNQISVNRENDERVAKANHGLARALIANMVKGVSEGFKRELDINGVGYRAEVKGNHLQLTLGYSHPVLYPIPTGIKVTVDKQTHISLLGADKQLVGQVASEIRSAKKPEPYKGKGVKYTEETIRRKAGKSATGSAGKGK